MRKRFTAAILVGALGVGGAAAAVAIPALADTSTPSPTQHPAVPNTDQRENRILGLLKGLVDDKTITQDQADKVAKTLAQADAPGGRFGHGPGMLGVEGPEGLDAAAKALGMSTDDVRAALRSGSTLADLAKKQGKSEDDVVSAIVNAAKARIAQAVKDGTLTQAEADRITASLPDRVKSMVENTRPMRGGGPDANGQGHGWKNGAPQPPSSAPSASSETSAFSA